MNKTTVYSLVVIHMFAYSLFSATEIKEPANLWYPVILTFEGPHADESSTTYRNYRLNVTFKKGAKSYFVPGYFAADGNAAETSGSRGNKWRVKFTPDESGQWDYSVSFHTGPDIAIGDNPNAGSAVEGIDGETGTFHVGPYNPSAPGLYAKGLLTYVGEHYAQFKGNKEWLVKSGPGSPEDFFGYQDFDGTYDYPIKNSSTQKKDGYLYENGGKGLHRYLPHESDWRSGDPSWKGGEGKGIIGAINYLTHIGANTIYLILNTSSDDADNCWPWTDRQNYLEYDVSKLEQWDIVFEHMDRMGLSPSLYLSEADNNVDLNGGEMGLEYRIYYREMIARFSHHLGWRYNIGEEPTMSNAEVRKAAELLRSLDPYGHPIGSHCSHKIDKFTEMYDSLLGLDYFDGAWMQLHRNHHTEIANWRSKSAESGHKWIVGNDESWEIEPDNVGRAEEYYWKTIMAGGEGMTQYLGYDINDISDITIEDFRKIEVTQKVMANARKLLSMPAINKHLPSMKSEDGLIGNSESDNPPFCFAREGELYVIYREKSDDIKLDLSKQPGDYSVKWYDPRKGGELQDGSLKKVAGGGTVSLGEAPSDNSKSWAIVLSLLDPTVQLIEAENMNLTQYQIEKNGPRSYVRLTSLTGIAQFEFSLPSGKYDIDVCYLSESVGQNTYAMYIANNQIVAWLGKDRDDQWHRLSEQKWHAPHHIAINKGDEIRIEALSDNGSFAIFDYIKFTASDQLSSPTPTKNIPTPPRATTGVPTPQADVITIYPSEYAWAIKNPLKGFRPNKQDHEYGTLIKNYFKWNQLENQASDDVAKIKAVCDRKWNGIENKNIKIIPRVYLAWPGQKGGWPADMTTGDFTSDEFKQRVIALIKKLGQAWDNDARVAYIEMGLIGEWGEMEFPDTTDDIKEAIAAQFSASFQNKRVMIRWPNTYNDHIYNVGYYWDSFAHHDQEYCGFHINNTTPKWKTAVIGGEVAYNWGNVQIQPGQNPDESLTNPVHRDYIIDRIRKLHANHLGWIANYDQSDARVRAGADIMQKALGYRFVISEVTYPKRVDNDTHFTISFKVKNTGSSPFYYKWPVEVSLLDRNTKQVVWKKQCTNIDIRNWMPGDQWGNSTHSYTIPAETYTVHQTLLLSGVSSGEYILALAILDPAGNRPCARFAINNYYHGGRHPIGRVGINHTIDSFSITGFDDLQSDKSLLYEKTKE
ncbi:DUF4832 domain-containing protein [Planctomycetota bacterium]